MRKRTHMVLLVLICLLCTGCAGIDFWHDIPRDYALSQEVVESTLKMEDLPEEEAPQVNFLMEEIYPYAQHLKPGGTDLVSGYGRHPGKFRGREEAKQRGT